MSRPARFAAQMTHKAESAPKPLLTLEEGRRYLAMGETKFKELVRTREIRTVADGRWVRVETKELDRWIAHHVRS